MLVAGLLAGSLLAPGPARSQVPVVPDNPGPNASIERLSHGEYLYRTIKDRTPRGSERFELIAHPDGTRTLIMWNDLFAKHGQIHAVLRVDARFRPLETQYVYWSDGRFKGAANFRLDGTTLAGTVRTPDGGLATQRLTVPEAVSFATHPLAGDGWHAWHVESRQPAVMVNFDAGADITMPAAARLQLADWRRVRSEAIDVPAGRFDCEVYAGAGATVWVTGPDRVLVKFEWPALDLEYVLARFGTGRDRGAVELVSSAPAVKPAVQPAVQPAVKPAVTAAPGANNSVLRWHEGEYSYRTLADGRERGWERFRHTVQADGSRTMLMWQGLRARSAQFTVLMRGEQSFLPVDAYASYWNDGKYKGSVNLWLRGTQLSLASHGAFGEWREETTVPERVSLGTHPIAADGWHLWELDAPVSRGRAFELEATADLGKPIRGKWRDLPMARVGVEKIKVPAGEFETVHYRLGGTLDIWLHGEDRVLVRMRHEKADRDYVLVRYEGG